MTRRTSTQAQLGESASSALQRAMANEKGGFEAAPSRKGGTGRKRGQKAGGDYDGITEAATDLFARDGLRDDGKGSAPGELFRIGEPKGEDVQAALAALIAEGKADSSRAQQGGIVATKKGRVVKWLVPAERVKGKGTVAATNARAAARQQERFEREGLGYAERADRRIRAIAKSWFGTDHENVVDAMRKAYRADRKRRGWAVPDFRTLRDNDEEGED